MKRVPSILMLLVAALALHACGAEKSEVEGQAEVQAEQKPEPAEHVEEGIAWMNYDEGMKKAADEGKYVLIDFWTGWCHWCKVMDKDTYTDEAVQALLAESFVSVKVDAESAATQGDETAPTGVELARQFQVSSFPTTWFTDASGKKIAPLPGFAPPEQFLLVLEFISTGSYENQNFKEFQAGRAKG